MRTLIIHAYSVHHFSIVFITPMPQAQDNSKQVSNSFIKFGITGVGSTLIHTAVATVLISMVGSNIQIGNGIAFVIATCFSYTANTLWSFSNEINRRTASRFIIISLGGLVLTILISTIADTLSFHYNIGIAMVVVCVPIYSFIAHRLWTYR